MSGRAVLVAGPTCSGKSAAALALAERLGGVVINADSMQVYAELRVLTARPDADALRRAPHGLYGVRPAAQPGSVAWWRASALAEMERAQASGRVPILCGGTGLYFAALQSGLADIPEPGAAAREAARALLATEGAAALHARLAAADPDTARGLRPQDGQRLARAWEVLSGTGRGLAAWQASAPPPPDWRFTAVMLDPPREALREAIAARLDRMLEEGALAEVAALLALGLPASLPAMRAHGVPELAAHLAGQLGLEAARARIRLATGQYTKRQATWFRHHELGEAGRRWRIAARIVSPEQFPVSDMADMIEFVRGVG